jgi:hypothetical protein
MQSSCHGATAGESSLSSDGVETRKHAIFCLAWRPTNKQGLSIALQGDVAGLGRNESTPLAHARVYQRMQALTEKKKRELSNLQP